MRKLYGIMMTLALAGTITACGSKAATETTAAGTTVAETTAAETTAAETKETETTGAVETSTQETSKGESGDEKELSLANIHQAVKKAYGEDYIPSSPFDKTALKQVFGVSEDLYDEFIAEGPMISVNVETFVAIRAKEGKAEAVETALNEYRNTLLADTMQYPANQIKIQASQVVREGDYVFFVMLGAPSQESEEKGEDEALKSAQEKNEIALGVIDGFFQE